jgi:Glutathione-dependent formaldehyde-activating enzyme
MGARRHLCPICRIFLGRCLPAQADRDETFPRLKKCLIPLKGTCQCRKVRYEIRPELLTVYVCHCTECQWQSGSAFSLSMIVPREGVAIVADEPKEWLRRTLAV